MAAAPLAGDLVIAAAPPPTGTISSGRQITMEELNNAISDYSKRLYDYVNQNSTSMQFSRIGKLGGRPRK